MATTREYKGSGGFCAQIAPTGFRGIKMFRCRPLGWFPYLSGRDIRFRVSVEGQSAERIPYEWRLSCSNVQSRFWVRGNKENPIGGKLEVGQREEIILIGSMFDMGQYSFQMRWKDEVGAGNGWQDVLYFSVEDNDFYISRLMQTLTSGVIGAIIGALIALGVTR